jgi:hypothetical protein
MAAKKAVQELEDGKGWIHHAKDSRGRPLQSSQAAMISQIARREAVRLGVEYQVGGKWCSFVAVSATGDEREGTRPHPQQNPTKKRKDNYSIPPVRRVLATKAARRVAVSTPAPKRPPPRRRSMPSQPMAADGNKDGQGESGCTGKASAAVCCDQGSSMASHPELEALSGLVTLQTFIGSWKWDHQLEKILNMTKAEAAKAIKLAVIENAADILATLCTIIYLKNTMASHRDSWELMADKAESWLEAQTGQTMSELEALAEDANLLA